MAIWSVFRKRRQGVWGPREIGTPQRRFKQMTDEQHERKSGRSLTEVLRSSPMVGVDLNFERPTDCPKYIDFRSETEELPDEEK